MVQKLLTDPQKRPYGQKFLPREVQTYSFFRVKFASQIHKNQNNAGKWYTLVLGNILGPNWPISKILTMVEISTALGTFLKILGCGIFFSQKFRFFKSMVLFMYFIPLFSIWGTFSTIFIVFESEIFWVRNFWLSTK